MKKNKKPFHFSFIDKIMIIYIVIASLGVLNLKSFETSFNNILLEYAKKEAVKISNLIINKTISEELENKKNIPIISLIEKDNGDIDGLDLNTIEIADLINKISEKILNYINVFEQIEENPFFCILEHNKEGIIINIPFGIINKNSLLSNFGPLIPAKMNFVGDYLINPYCDISSHGINNTLIKVLLKIEIGVQMLLPFISDTIKVKMEFPCAIKYINGQIPAGFIGTIPVA